MTGITFKLYKEMHSLELIVIDDTELTLVLNGILDEFSESAFCELYQAVKLVMTDYMDEYSVFLGDYGVRITADKAVLWLDSSDGDKAAKEITLYKFFDYLEAYRREWLKDFGDDLTLPIYNYVPVVDGIITNDDCD